MDGMGIAIDSLQKAAKAAPRGRPFPKGQSGNPKGRARGSRNNKTLAAEMFLDGEAEALARKAVELALGGDPTALRLCLDRIIAPRRERAVRIELPRLDSAADLARIMGAVTAAAAEGRLTPGEAFHLAQTVAAAMRAIEASELEERLKQVEDQIAAEQARQGIDSALARRFARST